MWGQGAGPSEKLFGGKLKALAVRDRFGDVDQIRHVLRALTALLDELDDPALEEPKRGRPAKESRRKNPS